MDYLDFFGFEAEPFAHAPLPRFYFASEQHSKALRRLEHSVSRMQGLALLVAEIGRGKTTLARRLLDALPPDEFEAALLVIIHAGITPSWLVKRIAMQLGVRQPVDEKMGLMAQLYQRLVEIKNEGRKAVVLVDEAQMLNSREIMEEFRGLLNLEEPGNKLISFVFFGMPNLDQRLALDPPLAQRVAMRCTLDALSSDDTFSYVSHRVNLAGGSPGIFSKECLEEIHDWTSGVPRLINTLCDNVLLELYLAQTRVATVELIAEVAENLTLKSDRLRQREVSEVPRLTDHLLATEGGPGADAILTVKRSGVAVPSSELSFSPDDIAARIANETSEVTMVEGDDNTAAQSMDIEDPLAFLVPPEPPGVSGPPGLQPADKEEEYSGGAGKDVLARTLDGDDEESLVPETQLAVRKESALTSDTQESLLAKENLESSPIADFGEIDLGMERSGEIGSDDFSVDVDLDFGEEEEAALADLDEQKKVSPEVEIAPRVPAAKLDRRSRRVTMSNGKVIDLKKIDDILSDLE